jgi:NitT/TauT family transport system permease protein
MLAIVLTGWELLARATNPLLFAAPSRVVTAFGDLINSGRLGPALTTTLSTLVVGFLVSVVSGISLGVLLGRSRTWGRLIEPYVNAIYATPRVVIIPLVIIWFGVGYNGRLFIIWLGAVIPILLNTAIGMAYTPTDLVETARSFQVSKRQMIRHVVLPAAVPFVVSGLRVGAERALVGAVIGEIFLSLTGVGGIIQTESERFRSDTVLAAAAVYAVLGWLVITALGAVENRFIAWKSN